MQAAPSPDPQGFDPDHAREVLERAARFLAQAAADPDTAFTRLDPAALRADLERLQGPEDGPVVEGDAAA